MKLKPQPRIWIVEMLNTERERWEPTVGCALDRKDALKQKKEWKQNNPDDKFRIIDYERKGGDGRNTGEPRC